MILQLTIMKEGCNLWGCLPVLEVYSMNKNQGVLIRVLVAAILLSFCMALYTLYYCSMLGAC